MNNKTKLAVSFIIGGIVGLIVLFCVLLAATVAMKAHAYTKIGAGYILEQPKRYNFTYTDGTKSHINTNYQDYSLHVEHGSVIGNVYFGVYGTYSNGEYHDPYKIELFADYDWINTKWHLKTGVGYKVKYQDYAYVDGEKVEYTTDKDLGRITARIGLSRDFGDIEVGLWHHSQWFRGFPFDNKWEYHKTELTVSWGF